MRRVSRNPALPQDDTNQTSPQHANAQPQPGRHGTLRRALLKGMVGLPAAALLAPALTSREARAAPPIPQVNRVGRARPDGQFDVIFQTPDLIEPNPFSEG